MSQFSISIRRVTKKVHFHVRKSLTSFGNGLYLWCHISHDKGSLEVQGRGCLEGMPVWMT
jgi:hypothetical protein